jgi:hypothetical protein
MQARTQSFNMDFIWCCEDCLLCESFAPPNERDLVGFSCVCFVSRKLESMDSKPPGLRRMRSICEALVALEDIWSNERGSSMVGLLKRKAMLQSGVKFATPNAVSVNRQVQWAFIQRTFFLRLINHCCVAVLY